MKTSRYNVFSDKISAKGITAAFVSDLHNCRKNAENALASMEENKPDFILFSGDAIDGLRKKYEVSLEFFEKAVRLAPVFFSVGNHEIIDRIFEDFSQKLSRIGVSFLDNEHTVFKGIHIGGLSFINEDENAKTKEKREKFLPDFCALSGFKILLSHVPAYYTEFLREKDVDLILSGHSHGGQIGFGKRGVYAPDQGFFPKYVGDFYDNRLIVTRGLGQTAHLPRFFNPYEIVYISFNQNSI